MTGKSITKLREITLLSKPAASLKLTRQTYCWVLENREETEQFCGNVQVLTWFNGGHMLETALRTAVYML